MDESDAAACPICAGRDFAEFGSRPAALCRICGSLERHRALAAAQAGALANGAGRRALEVGPLNAEVFGAFLRRHGWEYVCSDQSRRGNPNDPRSVGFIDFEADLTDLAPLAVDSVDLVMVQHVIEEIADYERALGEISRVLAPGGRALLEIPFDPARETSERQDADRFGNVWRFGADLPGTVRSYFASADVVELREGAYAGRLLVCDQSA